MAARRAHNPKVVGSNPAPATKFNIEHQCDGFYFKKAPLGAFFDGGKKT